MKQLTTTLNGKEILLVEVPEDATHAIELTYWRDKIVCWYDCGFSEIEIKSPGNWKLLGLCSEIKEEVAATLVEHCSSFGRVKRYKDYEFVDSCFYKATESLETFIESHHFNPETTVLLIKE